VSLSVIRRNKLAHFFHLSFISFCVMASSIMGFGVSSISTITYSQRRYLHLHKFQVNQNGKVPLLLRSTNNVGLAPLWDDGYGNRTVEDYFAASKEICKYDGGPPRLFCPIECASPFQGSPTLMFLPGKQPLFLFNPP